MPYASVQAIRESAGLLSRVQNETPKGTVDNSNRDFVVKRRPIVDGNNDDEVDATDVNAYVNGALVAVSAVDAKSGKVTLQTAPATGTAVTIDYQFSPITDEYTEGKQEEADSWVDLKLRDRTINPALELPLNPVPGVIATAAEMYAAGLILTRDWGSRVDSEQTSKDGFAKIKQARELIADYIAGVLADQKVGSTTSDNAVSTASDADPFSRTYEGDGFGCDPDDAFMRRQC